MNTYAVVWHIEDSGPDMFFYSARVKAQYETVERACRRIRDQAGKELRGYACYIDQHEQVPANALPIRLIGR
jgi:hypothetical protein